MGQRQLFVESLARGAAKQSRATELVSINRAWTMDADGAIWRCSRRNRRGQQMGRERGMNTAARRQARMGFLGCVSIHADACGCCRGQRWLDGFSRYARWKWKEFENIQAALVQLKNDPPQFPGVHRELCLRLQSDLSAPPTGQLLEIVIRRRNAPFQSTDMIQCFTVPASWASRSSTPPGACASPSGIHMGTRRPGWKRTEAERSIADPPGR